jgi:hypothetical protein
LGKKSDALAVEAEKLHPIATPTGRRRCASLARQTIKRTVEELRARVADKAKDKRSNAARRARTPRDELDIEHRAHLRELTRQAHGTNLDLGAHLLNDLVVVAPDDMDVARFFAYGLLGPESPSFLGTSDHVARTIAANGLRLVLEEHRVTTTPTLKSGKRGVTKVRATRSARARPRADAHAAGLDGPHRLPDDDALRGLFAVGPRNADDRQGRWRRDIPQAEAAPSERACYDRPGLPRSHI